MNDTELHRFLMGFAKYEAATGESRRLCLELVRFVLQETGSLPVPTSPGPRHKPALIYRPDDARNFASIVTVDQHKPNVVVSLHGNRQDHDRNTERLIQNGTPQNGNIKIAVRGEDDLPNAKDAIMRAYRLKREKIERARTRHAEARR